MGTVELKSVQKIYDNHFEAVKGISASVTDGEFISVLGPSGCGKTSTLRMVAGLETITSGEVLIDGIRVNELETRERNVAMAFESYALYPHLTVAENIAYPLEVRKIPADEIAREVDSICDSLGISQYKNQYPSALSGGAQQRTGLARALVRPASIYLLDEVLSHLDAAERTMLRGEIRRIQKLKGLTALFVTHDQLEALAMSDRIIVMNDGEIQQVGTPEEIYDFPQNLFVAGFVGEPAMNMFQVTRSQEDGHDLIAIGNQKVAVRDLALDSLPEQNEFILGVRPKHVLLDSSPRKGAISGRVYAFELLGDYTLVTIRLDSGALAFKIGGEDLHLDVDSPVFMHFDSQKVLYYDAATTRLVGSGTSRDVDRV